MNLLSVVVPVFNEEETLRYSFDRLVRALEPLLAADVTSIELVLVNDGSRDQTPKLLEQLKTTAPAGFNVEVVHLSRNFGHSAAVFAGLETSRGDAVAIIDADLQDPPELIPKMLAKIGPGADVVFGQRLERKDESFFKKATAWAFYRLIARLAGLAIPKDTGDFRVMTREVADAVLSCREPDPFLRGLVTWVGFEQVAYPYERDGRKYGTTKYPFSRMLRFAVTAIVSFSSFPLKMAFLIGLVGLLFFAVFTIWALWVKAAGHVVPGWTSLLIGFTFGQSITLLLIGILGTYIGQTFKNVQGRPRYIRRRTPPANASRPS